MWKRLAMLWALVRGDARRLWLALRHPQSPGWLKLAVVGMVIYLISPLDLLPDFIPVLGIVDDLVLLPLAIQGSLRGKALPRGFIAFGEVGLAGEVRPAPRGQERLKEAAKLGFSVAMVPKANAPKKPIEGLTIHAVDRIEEAIGLVRSL